MIIASFSVSSAVTHAQIRACLNGRPPILSHWCGLLMIPTFACRHPLGSGLESHTPPWTGKIMLCKLLHLFILHVVSIGHSLPMGWGSKDNSLESPSTSCLYAHPQSSLPQAILPVLRTMIFLKKKIPFFCPLSSWHTFHA